jgi:hypothetical protein
MFDSVTLELDTDVSRSYILLAVGVTMRLAIDSVAPVPV